MSRAYAGRNYATVEIHLKSRSHHISDQVWVCFKWYKPYKALHSTFSNDISGSVRVFTEKNRSFYHRRVYFIISHHKFMTICQWNTPIQRRIDVSTSKALAMGKHFFNHSNSSEPVVMNCNLRCLSCEPFKPQWWPHPISLNINTAWSNGQVMRINEMITKDEMLWC